MPEQTLYKELTHSFDDLFAEKTVDVKYGFRRPNPQDVQRAQKGFLKDSGRAFTNLLMTCVKPEDKTRLQQDLETYPGLSTTFGGALMSSVGMGDLGK